jgi:hypothetical protein
MKLQAQSSKLQRSPNCQAPTGLAGNKFEIWGLGILLSFELWILDFDTA